MSEPTRLVLVPGLGLDERSSARLRRRCPADVVLLPGMGLAEPVPPLDELARRLLDAIGPGPVVLVGHSQSCQVVAAAATDPRMRSVVVLPWRWLRTALRENWAQAPLVLAQWWRTGPRAMRALWQAAAPDRIDRRLAGVTVPVTVVCGTRDRLCPPDWAVQVCAAAPRGRLVEIPGAAHMTVHTHPDAVARVVADAAGLRDGVAG